MRENKTFDLEGYIQKEKLWPYLDEFVDAALEYMRQRNVTRQP